ncbi:uncharacterized protein [Clytia hemisphaerica]|uniref:uncharacterized protein n=1 Tax=Clytia hemisphaerica TaxID=252671 RepID=UPI0034D42C8D|eukprot:TCONS_00068962-protein
MVFESKMPHRRSQLLENLWGKLLFLSFHLTTFCLILILSWNVDNWIEITPKRWVDVDQSSKHIFAVACGLPTLFLLVIIDMELFGVMPWRWKKKIFTLTFIFAVLLFICSVLVVKNVNTLSYAPIYCHAKVQCGHLKAASAFGFLTSFCLLGCSIALGAFIIGEN